MKPVISAHYYPVNGWMFSVTQKTRVPRCILVISDIAWRNVVTLCLHNDPPPPSPPLPPPSSLLFALMPWLSLRFSLLSSLLSHAASWLLLLLRRQHHHSWWIATFFFFLFPSCSPLALSSSTLGSRADAPAHTLRAVSEGGKWCKTNCDTRLVTLGTCCVVVDAH